MRLAAFLFGLFGTLTATAIAILEILLRGVHPVGVSISTAEAIRSLALIWAVLMSIVSMVLVFRWQKAAAAVLVLAMGLEYFGSPTFWYFPTAFWVVSVLVAVTAAFWPPRASQADTKESRSHLWDVG